MSIEPDQQFSPPPLPESTSPRARSRQVEQNETEWNSDSGPELSGLQMQAIALMLAGQRDTLIARRLNVGRTTLWRWRNRSTPFRTAMRELFRGHWAVSEARISRTVSEALGVIHEAIHCDNDDYRIKCALAMVRVAARVLIHRPSAGSCDPEKIRNELIEEGLEPDDTIDTQPAVKLKKLKPKPRPPKWPIYPIPTKLQAFNGDPNGDVP